jgi:hypothetical protein
MTAWHTAGHAGVGHAVCGGEDRAAAAGAGAEAVASPLFQVGLRRSLLDSDDLAVAGGYLRRPLHGFDRDLSIIGGVVGELPAILVYGDVQAGRRVYVSMAAWNLTGRPGGEEVHMHFGPFDLPGDDPDGRLAFEDALGRLCAMVAGGMADWFHLVRFGRARLGNGQQWDFTADVGLPLDHDRQEPWLDCDTHPRRSAWSSRPHTSCANASTAASWCRPSPDPSPHTSALGTKTASMSRVGCRSSYARAVAAPYVLGPSQTRCRVVVPMKLPRRRNAADDSTRARAGPGWVGHHARSRMRVPLATVLSWAKYARC